MTSYYLRFKSHPQRLYFQVGSHSQVQGLGLQRIYLRDTTQPTIGMGVKKCEWPLESGQSEETHSPLEPPEKNTALPTP